MDKDDASVEKCLRFLQKLHENSLAVNIQIYMDNSSSLKCILDLVDCQLIFFEGNNGTLVRKQALNVKLIPENARKWRMKIVEKLAELDEQFPDEFLQVDCVDKIPTEAIIKSIA